MMKKYWWIVGLLIALALALLSPLASTSPDGLERVAEDHGFLSRALGPAYRLIPDYAFPGIHNEIAATIVAALLGTLLVFGLWTVLVRFLRADANSGDRQPKQSPTR